MIPPDPPPYPTYGENVFNRGGFTCRLIDVGEAIAFVYKEYLLLVHVSLELSQSC